MDVEKASLASVLKILRKQSGYGFVYNSSYLKQANPISLRIEKKEISEALQLIFTNQPFNYIVNDKVITILPKRTPPSVGNPKSSSVSEGLLREYPEVRGRVTDQLGTALADATVRVVSDAEKRGDLQTKTDHTGHFVLRNVPDDALLEITYVGYLPEIVQARPAVGDIVLKAGLSQLDEIVVVGYGIQRKRDLTGAISSVKSEDIQKVAASSFTSAIQGKVPGVMISQTSGSPGSSASVRIRGVGSTGGNQPLYVIDGLPVGGGSMGMERSTDQVDGLSIINPADIESIEVLKDASAAAIYGSRAANGVILVTTKRGKEGKAEVNLNAYTGFRQLWRKPEFLNAEEFATLANELYQNSGMTPNPEWSNPAGLGEGVNWIEQVFRNAPLQNYDLSIRGGTAKLKAAASLGYTDEDGTMIETWYKRYTGRLTTDLEVNRRLSFGGTLAFASTISKAQQNQVLNYGIFNLAQQYYPTLGVNSVIDGSSAYYTTQADNPVMRARSMDNQLRNLRLFGNIYGELKILENLKFRTNIGIDGNNSRTMAWEPTAIRGHYRNLQAYLSETYSSGFNWLIENTLTFSKELDNHRIDAVIGQTAQRNESRWISAIGREFANEQLQVINGSKADQRQAGGAAGAYSLASYLGRVNYAYKDKYLFSVSLRRDGSSNFGPRNKWGNFPSVAAGWNIDRESFLENANWLSQMKIRGSWGQLGNDAIGAFSYMSTLQNGTAADNYIFGATQQILTGTSLVRPGNPELKWETSEQFNLGVDASFLNNRLYVVADYYVKNTKGMLINLPVSLESGFGTAPSVNGGAVRNKGIELQAGFRQMTGDLSFDLSGNIATLHNKVTSLGVGQPIVGPTIAFTGMSASYTAVGQPIGFYRGYIVDGIFQGNEEVDKNLQPNAVAGDLHFRDVNGDNRLTDADRVNMGKPWPDLMYGVNLDLAYKGFDLNVAINGIAGNELFHANKFSIYPIKYFGGSGVVNASRAVLDRWVPGSGRNEIPQLKYNDPNGNYTTISTFYIEDGSYMRVRNLTLGYTVPPALVIKAGLKSLRLYLSGQNLYTLTRYTGFDPEVGSNNPIRAGIDDGVYPLPRTFILGVRVGI
ncbi:MAG: hypothetical protein ABS46_06885 [Cytophagaceae bacterium SCN 52-12]|nr:MAG: hypothetical protein ABS46_06885 [Cytophagaceae bacterium SCN 52-12]